MTIDGIVSKKVFDSIDALLVRGAGNCVQHKTEY